MNSPKNTAIEGLLSSAERWTPADSELWRRWRGTLSEEQRCDVLLPLQALLSGLVAYRHLENHQALPPQSDFRPHLHSVHAGYVWALDLVARLLSFDAREATAQLAGAPGTDPVSSLLALEQSLCDALRLSERLLDLALVDAGAFEASTDFFLRELERNAFFNPPDPLEFSNVDELVRGDVLEKDLDFWKSGAATMVALLTMLRAHRFLGIVDRQLGARDGAERVEVVTAGIRRELGALRLFLSLQGREDLAAELEAVDLQAVREARQQLKEAAKTLRAGGTTERSVRRSQRVRKNPQQDIWAFRFILRAFVAKASALSAGADGVAFVREFARHFRVFGPKLMRATDYARSRPLTAVVSALNRRAGAEQTTIELAAEECERFAEHLDASLKAPAGLLHGFDKQQAADELRAYLESANDRSANRRAAAAAFGLVDPNAQAS